MTTPRQTPPTPAGRRALTRRRWLAALLGVVLAVTTGLTAAADTLGPPVFGKPTVTTYLRNEDVTEKTSDCGPDRYLTALTGGVRDASSNTGPARILSVGGACERLSVDDAGEIDFGTDSLTALRLIGDDQSVVAAPCDPDWAVVGFSGGVEPGGAEPGGADSGGESRPGAERGRIVGIRPYCRQILPDGTLGRTVKPYPNGGLGRDVNALGPYFCPTGAVATGVRGFASPDPDADELRVFALTCRTLNFPTVRPEETNLAWPTALTVGANSTTPGAVTAAGQDRWYRFPVQPGSRVTVDLTDLPVDYDLTLFKDIGQSFDTLTSTEDLTKLSAEFAGDAFSPSVFSPSVFSPSVFSPSVFSPSVFSPSVFSPSVFSPSVFSPSVFSPSVFSPSVFSPSVFSPSVFSPAVDLSSVFSPSVFSPSVFSPSVFSDAFSSAQTRSLIGVSARDGQTPEAISSATWNNTGFFYVRVQGRNGVSSATPFSLKVATTGGGCSATLDTFSTLDTLTGTAGGAQTVIVTDPSRMAGSAVEKAALAAQLTTFAASVGGAVVDLNTSDRIRHLNTQADSTEFIDCPYAKNLVAEATRDIVNSYRDGSGTLKYVVVVGADSVVPFFRYPDTSGLGPESNYAPPVADKTASEASLRGNYVLGQDAYGTRSEVSIKGTVLPVPDLAVGRLVESPADISATLTGYLARSGAPLVPTSTLATGYDFLTDAADAVAKDFADGTPGGRHDELVTDATVPPTTTTPAGGSPSRDASWTATDLRAQLLTRRHDLVFLAGHFSANNTLAADYDTTVNSTEIANAPDDIFRDALVFSAGCHSGYTIVDGEGVQGVTEGLDWTEAFARRGATLIAGTGYQYGDTDFLEYSERLYANFARQLRLGSGTVAVGSALVQAKQDYLNKTASLGGIDQKALLEATLYGLPMLGVNLPQAGRVSAPTDTTIVNPTPFGTDPGNALGLRSADVDLDATLGTRTRTLTNLDGGSLTATYRTGPDGVSTSPAEPALPLISANVTVPGQVLRGVGLRSATYTDTDNITPLTGAPATETHSPHGPFVTPAFYPNRLSTPNYFDALDSDAAAPSTRLMVTPAQHRSDRPGSLTDTLRAYSSVGNRLFYSSYIAKAGANRPALAAPPSLTGITAAPDGNGGVTISARVVGDPSAGIQQVWATYTGELDSPFHGRWRSIDLAQNPTDSTLWSATLDLAGGQRAADVRLILQAVNGVGLVGIDDNQGSYFTPGVTVGGGGAAQAATALQLEAGSGTTGSYGDSVPVRARLTDVGTGAGLVGRAVTFTVGGASRTAYTSSTGTVETNLPLSVVAGRYQLTAAYDGDATTAGANATPAAFRVDKRATRLALALSADQTTATATLRGSDDVPLREKSVYLAFTNAGDEVLGGRVVATDQQGRADLTLAGRPRGTTGVSAWFGRPVPTPGGGTMDLTDGSFSGSGPVTTTLPDDVVTVEARPDRYQTPEGTTLTVTPPGVLANDTAGSSAALVTGPRVGKVTLAATGAFSYVPPTDFVGTASFTYLARRDNVSSAPATVTITVTEVTPRGCTITGTSGNDTLRGTSRNDVICGLGGRDTITGGGGNDVIWGGSGDDTISGGTGPDVIRGQGGNDTMNGNDGVDVIWGGSGNDTLNGDDGLDALDGQDGNDTLKGGNDPDLLVGGSGLDKAYGGNGADFIDLRDGAGGDAADGGPDRDACLRDAGDTVTAVP